MFQRPTLKELIDRVLADISSRVTGEGQVLRRSVLGILGRAFAGVAHLLHGHIDWASKQIIYDTAEDEFLKRWASIWGIKQNPATYAKGNIKFTGINATVIPAGTILQRNDGIEYAVDSDATIAFNEAVAAVTCKTVGDAGNVAATTILSLLSPLSGVDNDGVIEEAVVNGLEPESDSDLRVRLLERIQTPARGGSADDYVYWAKEIQGVEQAWAFPLYNGPGTVGVSFVTSVDNGMVPDAGLIAEVQAHIDSVRPVGIVEVVVFAPELLEMDMGIQFLPFNSTVQDAIESELLDLVYRKARPGGVIYISELNEAISVAQGEIDHKINYPIYDIVEGKVEAGPEQIIVLGPIYWQSL